MLKSATDTAVDDLPNALPRDEPCYAFFAWPQTSTPPRRDIGQCSSLRPRTWMMLMVILVFIYCCPQQSPVRFRMMYSSGCLTVPLLAKPLFTTSNLIPRKVETSEPQELTEEYLKSEVGITTVVPTGRLDSGENKPFAKPKGPPRRR